MLPTLADLRRLVRDAARADLLPRFADVMRHMKTDGSLVTAADHAMQQHMQRALAARWPEYAFLGEEMTATEQERLVRAAANGLWCLDPLDGTSNFAAGIPFFAVSLALLVDGRPALGLVYDPVRDECFAARRGEGAWLNDAALGARRGCRRRSSGAPSPAWISSVWRSRSPPRSARSRPTARSAISAPRVSNGAGSPTADSIYICTAGKNSGITPPGG